MKKAKALKYRILDKLNGFEEQTYENNMCVARYILQECKGKSNLLTLDEEKLIRQFKYLHFKYTKGISCEQIIQWVQKYHFNTISIHCLDPFLKRFEKHIASHCVVSLIFVVNNQHIYPITNDKMKQYISKTGHFDNTALVSFKYNGTDYMNINTDGLYQQVIQGKLSNKVVMVDDVEKAATDYVMHNNSILVPACMKIKEGKITSFITDNGLIFQSNYNYENKMKICKTLKDKYNCDNFTFKNQTLSTVANELFKIVIGSIQKSQYLEETLDSLDKFNIKPLQNSFITNERDLVQTDLCIDLNSCYPNAILHNTYDYPIFTIINEIVAYDGSEILCGLYLIDDIVIEKLNNLHYPKQWVSYIVVQFMLENELIQKSSILQFLKATNKLEAKHMSKYMKTLMETIPRSTFGDDAKDMANSFIGCLGKKYSKKDIGCITTDWETLCGLYLKNPTEFSYTKLNDLYFCKETKKTRLLADNVPIYTHILSYSHIMLFKLIMTF